MLWRLSTQYRSRGISLLYLVAKENFTPLLGYDACLDIEVLEFTNLELIDTPQSEPSVQETPGQVFSKLILCCGTMKIGSVISTFGS